MQSLTKLIIFRFEAMVRFAGPLQTTGQLLFQLGNQLAHLLFFLAHFESGC